MPPAKRTTRTSATKAEEAKVEEAKAQDSKTEEPTSSVQAENVEAKVERNPELDGGVDKVADAKAEDAKVQKDAGTEKDAVQREKDLKAFVNEGRPTSESWDDPQVNLGNLPANHDPVVAADHQTASSSMSVDQGKLAAAAPVQISNFDNSDLSRNVLESMSHTAEVEVKDSDKSK